MKIKCDTKSFVTGMQKQWERFMGLVNDRRMPIPFDIRDVGDALEVYEAINRELALTSSEQIQLKYRLAFLVIIALEEGVSEGIKLKWRDNVIAQMQVSWRLIIPTLSNWIPSPIDESDMMDRLDAFRIRFEDAMTKMKHTGPPESMSLQQLSAFHTMPVWNGLTDVDRFTFRLSCLYLMVRRSAKALAVSVRIKS